MVVLDDTIDGVKQVSAAIGSGHRNAVRGHAERITGGGHGRGRIQSVDRALSILEVAAECDDGVSVSDMSDVLGLNVSTCHHLISTLAHRGFLSHLGRTRGYALGPRLRELVELADQVPDHATILSPELRAVGQRLGHGIQFATLSETSLMTRLSFPAAGEGISEPDEVEKMAALHATATGKAILAWITDNELARIISVNGLACYTPRTITTLSRLTEELRLVRRRKFAVDDQEFCEGIVCIGAAIRAVAGAVIGSISVTLEAERATDEYRDFLAGEVIAVANTCSAILRGNTK